MRLFAVVIDFATLLPLLLAGLIVAFAWLLLRSSAGLYDADGLLVSTKSYPPGC